MVTRTLPQLSNEQLLVIQKNVVKACNEVGNMKWIRSHVTSDGKHSFCELEAPSVEACRKHSAIAGLPVDDIIPLGLEIGPVVS